MGTVACFSFYPTKNLGGFGDGGMLTTPDKDLAERLAMLRVHGERRKYHHDLLGFNSRLDAIQAAVLRVKLRYLDTCHRGRQANANRYAAAFAAADGLPLCAPQPPAGRASHIYNQYVIRVPAAARDPLREHLRENNIGTEIYYPLPLHLQPCFEGLGYTRGDLPHAEAAADETLALPIYAELTADQIDCVAETVIAFVGKRAGAVHV
jgi:dTDP-4-amino-4,6-dideoxygalactose transaminase